MKSYEDIVLKVNHFLAEEFEIDPERISPEANLKETLDLDSLDYIDLLVVIETNFSFKVKPGDFAHISTFSDFYDYIISRINLKELV